MGHKRTVSRRTFLQTGALAGAALTSGGISGCGKGSPKRRGRVVILGFDGVEPTIVDRMLAAGELPNLAGLRERGAYHRLHTTIPPQSPVAWSSFATCKNPGGHGIYDLFSRDPATYMPRERGVETTLAILAADGSVVKPPVSVSHRKGRSFWAVADGLGIRSKILNVPYAYPPDQLQHGLMICGLGVPDVRCTASSSFSISEEHQKVQVNRGVVQVPLRFEGNAARVSIPAVRNTSKETQPEMRTYAVMELAITANRAEEQITIEAQGKASTLHKGRWSGWIESTYKLTPE